MILPELTYFWSLLTIYRCFHPLHCPLMITKVCCTPYHACHSNDSSKIFDYCVHEEWLVRVDHMVRLKSNQIYKCGVHLLALIKKLHLLNIWTVQVVAPTLIICRKLEISIEDNINGWLKKWVMKALIENGLFKCMFHAQWGSSFHDHCPSDVQFILQSL